MLRNNDATARPPRTHSPGLTGVSSVVAELNRRIRTVGSSNVKVLISGESGVGKELVARSIHRASERSTKPLVAVNCAGLPETLLESELFGHVRGSFTDASRDKHGLLEIADGGTIFLDEVGEMSSRMQAMLLRFTETGDIQKIGAGCERSVDVRVVSATNQDLKAKIASGEFREDLFYRLSVVNFRVPPLRDRREDIPSLLHELMTECSQQQRSAEKRFDPEALDALTNYHWPGNVRELRNVVECLLIAVPDTIIAPNHLPHHIRSVSRASEVFSPCDDYPTVAALYDRIVEDHVSFWEEVYRLYKCRELRRSTVTGVVSRGLKQTRGSYRGLVRLFNMKETDYARFLSFLRKNRCLVPFRQHRPSLTRPVRPAPVSSTVNASLHQFES